MAANAQTVVLSHCQADPLVSMRGMFGAIELGNHRIGHNNKTLVCVANAGGNDTWGAAGVHTFGLLTDCFRNQ